MKANSCKLLFILPFILFSYNNSFAQLESDFVGDWVGGVEVTGDYIALIMHFRVKDGNLYTTMDLPNQGIKGQVYKTNFYDFSDFKIETQVENTFLSFEGKMIGNLIEGTFHKGPLSAPFQVVRYKIIDANIVKSYSGEYIFENGEKVRFKHLARLSDDILLFQSISSGKEQWFFPVTETSFIAGPSYEAPYPIMRNISFTKSVEGQVDGFTLKLGNEIEIKAKKVVSQIAKVTAGESLIEQAENAFRSVNPLLAKGLLEKVWNDKNVDIKTKIKAGQYLTELNWKFFDDPIASKSIIEQTIQLDQTNYRSHLTFAKAANHFGFNEVALEKGLQAIKTSTNNEELFESNKIFSKIIFNDILNKIINGPNIDQFSDVDINKNFAKKTIQMLGFIVRNDPSERELLKTKFKLELILGKGKEALNTWNTYFDFSENDSNLNPLLSNTFDKLNKALSNWDNQPLNDKEKELLLLAVADAKYYDLAAMIAKTLPEERKNENQRVKEILAYYDLLQYVRKSSVEFYKKSALGKENRDEFRDALIEETQNLWSKLSWSSEPKEFSIGNLNIELDKRFGANVRFGHANGWFSITWGHKVIEYTSTIEQYGHKGNLKFRALDYLASNGFQEWYYGKKRFIGGWQRNPDIIYQVRPNYLRDPYNAWVSITDEKLIKWKVDIDKALLKDNSLSQTDSISVFHGMHEMIKLKGREQLLKMLENSGMSDNMLRNAFLKKYEKLTFESSILAHEGRHFIDHEIGRQQNINFSTPELEFRAKLSEISFSTVPFIALASILEGGIDDTPHGQANEQLLEGLSKWIKKHINEIKNFNKNRAALPQLYLLTDQQLKTAIKSLDVLAN